MPKDTPPKAGCWPQYRTLRLGLPTKTINYRRGKRFDTLPNQPAKRIPTSSILIVQLSKNSQCKHFDA